jgi:DNA-binding transcriptional MocR family regulator
VPVYSNPQGIVYSNEVIKELAEMHAAPDFKIFWDNAYAVHTFKGEFPQISCLLQACKEAGNYDRALMFSSFAKISLAGAGLGAMAASEKNLSIMREYITIQTIGPDKMNQLRHAKFFKNYEGVIAHMKKHGELLLPKFNLVLNKLEETLSSKGIASWETPSGGYFVSVDVLPGCAKRTISICAEAGLIMTNAGATFPYGKDPQDSNLRIAPTLPSISQLKPAIELFCLAVEMAALEKLIEKGSLQAR